MEFVQNIRILPIKPNYIILTDKAKFAPRIAQLGITKQHLQILSFRFATRKPFISHVNLGQHGNPRQGHLVACTPHLKRGELNKLPGLEGRFDIGAL